MSLQSIIHAALDAVKNFISHILPSSRKVLDAVTTIVNNVKTFDDAHPEVANTITAFIPGTIDDAIVAKAREYLPQVLVNLFLASAEIGKTPDEIVADGIKALNSLAPEYKATFLGSIWIHLSNLLTDDGVALSDLQKIQQTYYEATKVA